jgi:hypothetical protein
MVQQSSNKFSSKNTQGHGAMNIKQALTNQPNKHNHGNPGQVINLHSSSIFISNNVHH